MKIKVKTPAKINLLLEIVKKREDGFHEISSVMQAISLYDYLDIEVLKSDNALNTIFLSGNSPLIPYNENNIAYKAAELFMQKANLSGYEIKIDIQKNIPVAAGLAGGSSNAAGVLWGLNRIFREKLTQNELHQAASELGSDLNFCLQGGCCVATSRGEILSPIASPDLKIAIIKPKHLFISAKEAYVKFSLLDKKPSSGGLSFVKSAILENNSKKISTGLCNHLENGILPDYPEIVKIKEYLISKGCQNALMSGSGPSVFGIYDGEIEFSDSPPNWEVFAVQSITTGVSEV